jgi:predicted enzyme related to lactoylglutathione lyase
MATRRIVANLFAPDPAALAAFYQKVFDLDVPMDMGWIAVVQGEGAQKPGLQLAQHGGSETELPALSIEVDDLDRVHDAVLSMGAEITYGPITEPWGMRRFHMRDPAGNLINIATHE